MENSQKQSWLIKAFLLIIFPLVFSIVSLAISMGQTIPEVFYRVVNALYQSHVNSFLPPVVFGLNLQLLFYMIIIAASVGLYIRSQMKASPIEKIHFREILLITTLMMFTIITGMQTSGLLSYFRFWKVTREGKTLDEKYQLLNKDVYDFAKTCRHVFPGKHKAKFLTGMDIHSPKGMLAHRMLAYFLYPIDIRDIFTGDDDCLIIFHKDKPLKSVPANYQVIIIYNNNSLIAVRK